MFIPKPSSFDTIILSFILLVAIFSLIKGFISDLFGFVNLIFSACVSHIATKFFLIYFPSKIDPNLRIYSSILQIIFFFLILMIIKIATRPLIELLRNAIGFTFDKTLAVGFSSMKIIFFLGIFYNINVYFTEIKINLFAQEKSEKVVKNNNQKEGEKEILPQKNAQIINKNLPQFLQESNFLPLIQFSGNITQPIGRAIAKNTVHQIAFLINKIIISRPLDENGNPIKNFDNNILNYNKENSLLNNLSNQETNISQDNQDSTQKQQEKNSKDNRIKDLIKKIEDKNNK